MKKSKGFTLIELLAVIVILAIIAIIAVPIILNIINDSKESSNERSKELYIEAVEQAIARENLTREFNPRECKIENGKTICDGEELKIELKGKKPTSGSVILENGKVVSNTLSYGKERNDSSTNKIYSNGEVVYFDVDTGKKCTNYTETQSNTGVKSGCMKFYAFNDDGGDKLNLILDHNTTKSIAWNSSGSNVTGPDTTFLNRLKTDTANWKGTLTPENYTLDQSTQVSGANYTIDYSGYKARIITANEIAQITGNSSFDETSSSNLFYFDTNTTSQSNTCKEGNTTGCKYGWLNDNTYNCKKYGCYHNNYSVTTGITYGYWTITSKSNTTYFSWTVSSNSTISDSVTITNNDYNGLRPVINVLKSSLN